MSKVICQLSISLDGFVAGPDQSRTHPLGRGGEQLHTWAHRLENWRSRQGLTGGVRTVSADVLDDVTEGVGAYVMGRRMFGDGPGPWDESWTGWWGEDPPFRAPVYVLSHHPRAPLPMRGGTEFRFVTDGIDSALRQAREAAGDRDVAVAGGAETARQYLAAALLDELHLHLVPVLLGAGERLLVNVGRPALEQDRVVVGDQVTHLRYRFPR
ncbi:deaminase [Micromonospora rosaria]|uniref:Deaminase n=1 Tax=Micromonospora rosaria TaxID=47874 RepID=A0A136PLW3_9ACTN|nr:dihydrofolate reductase family protein [Micromonospora rosaria]KXK59384.1 deaminase [Micromonospora rosaria]